MSGKTDLDTSIEEVTHAVTEITKMDSVIAELTTKYEKVIFDVDTAAGMKAAKAARKDIREPRYLIENMRKAGKTPILDLGRTLDGRANEMKERLLAIESPIDNTIKEEETRAERERQDKIDAELKRVECIQERITEIRGAVAAVTSMGLPTSKTVTEFISDVEGIKVDESFDEFLDQANDAKAAVLATLRDHLKAANDREIEDERVKTEREELATLRAANEEREAKEKLEREKAETEARKKREAEEAKEREALAEKQAEIDAEEKRLAEERAKFEREKAEKEDADLKAEAKKQAELDKARKEKKAAESLAKHSKYPGDDAIIESLSESFEIPADVAISWLEQFRKVA